MTTPSRPAPRSRPRPAADEGVDPIDSTPVPRPAPVEAPAAASPAPGLPVRRKAEATVQLGTRIAVSVDALLTAAAQQTGATKRDLIEHAIRTVYGSN